MRTLVVDWLGRGGIAQCALAWADALSPSGGPPQSETPFDSDVTLVSRLGREITRSGSRRVVGVRPGRHRLIDHRRLALTASEVIRRNRPGTVVVQNYVVPALERPVYTATAEVGAHLIVVVHDHRLHRGTAGTKAGLRRSLAMADVIVCHSSFVADRVAPLVRGRDVEVLPLPLIAPSDAGGEAAPAVETAPGVNLALQFGMVGKAYKGIDTVRALAARGVPGWELAVVGPGAPEGVPGLRSVPHFVPTEVLVSSVRQSQATLLPYNFATQSGAVPFAQACGSVVVAHRVGGIPEQVEDGVTGILLPPRSSAQAWSDALIQLSDPARRTTLAQRARSAALARNAEFRDRVRALAA